MTASPRPPRLLGPAELERSDTVANASMNRGRELVGGNSYTHDLRLNPLEFLRERAGLRGSAAWLDLCCGSGRALIQAAEAAVRTKEKIRMVGVDLIDMFDATPPLPNLRLVAASVDVWRPRRSFDLITIVHGLHYVGDKLGLLARAASWLRSDGLFIGNMDLANLRDADGQPLGNALRRELRANHVGYNARHRLVTLRGKRKIRWSLAYLGADDQAGPNYTKQSAVDSYYRTAAPTR